MNTLILLETDCTHEDHFEIKDSKRVTHLREILKVKEGDELRVGLLGGSFGRALVTSLSPLSLKVEWKQASKQEILPQISLSIGLSRPPTLKKILEHATSMGVQSFEFYRAHLSEKSYADSKIFEKEAMKDLLMLGLSQGSSSLYLPEVSVTKSGVEALEPTAQSFVLSLEGDHSFWDYEIDFSKPLHFVLGPERGLTKSEDQSLIERGFRPLKIHPSILRVEIATFALLGALENMRSRLLRID